MAEREKVIKGLECCMVGDGHSPKCELCPYATVGDDTCQTMDGLFADALALLKAQEPMKPTRYQEGRWFKTWRCGVCGGTLVFRNGEDKPSYCTDCGRAVKWE